MKTILMVGIIGIIALLSLGVASADSVKVLSVLGNNTNLHGYVSPEGVTFTRANGTVDAGMIYSNILALRGTNNVPAQFASDLSVESGTFLFTTARAISGYCMFTFGRGDSVTLGKTGLLYHGQTIAPVNFNNDWRVVFTPAHATVTQNGTDVYDFNFDLTGNPVTPLSIHCLSQGLNKVETIAQGSLSMYAEETAAPTPSPEPTPTPEPAPAPAPAPQPSPTPTDGQLADALKRLDKVEEVVTYQNDLLTQAQDAIRNNTQGNQGLLIELDRLAAEQAAKDAAQDEEIGLLRGWLNNIQSFIEGLPFFGKGNQPTTSQEVDPMVNEKLQQAASADFEPVVLSQVTSQIPTTPMPIVHPTPINTDGLNQDEVLNLILARLDTMNARLDTMNARLDTMDARLDTVVSNQVIIVDKLNEHSAILQAIMDPILTMWGERASNNRNTKENPKRDI